jgi:Flp pilus assembly protein TadD
MFEFSTANYGGAIDRLTAILVEDPSHFEARLALGMAYYRQGDYATAIIEGKKAEELRPKEQLVHTNLSLFYMKAGDKVTAERHGLQARIASWREDATQAKDPATTPAPPADPELQIAGTKPKPIQFPSMPWKKNR